MASLWDRALPLAGKKLYTKRRKPFTFAVDSDRRIKVTVSSGETHEIYREQFDRAERAGMVFAGVIPKQLTDAGVNMGPSYVAGIINAIIERGL